ncbi:DUF3016 domain-containing protein [Celeribacter indicus]|uniref:DUF3016 domain-containing protein n=1 Tax=Celeribacter indicus TaxID=1208324 RepID=A0A0B5E427_9RHOB|nr:DUF3016 domain-containing protein [Celeribacter indicus]AJE47122.1 hypothetical protein P73_2407 [Celeribacter indicus]SDW90276.1 Protein of unknown function [Celeribacter indicus]
MFRPLCLSLLLALPVLATAAPVAAGGITVTYVAPESFRDREFRQAHSRASVLAEFDETFGQLAARFLPEGQDLAVEVLDIDLAGEFEPWNFAYRDVRILRDTTPPRIRLRYTLLEAGQVLAQEEVRLSDLNYLSWHGGRSSTERFAYDKRLLEDWFRKTFATAPAGRSRPAGPKS